MSEKKRDKLGRFKSTKFNSVYRQAQLNNKIMPLSHKVMCMALKINEIPKGFSVHHINKNTLDNSIDNLALLTTTGHNRIHSHVAWNKGITAEQNKKWAEAVKKQQEAREVSYILKCKESYDLRKEGLLYKEMVEKLKLTRAAIFRRIRKYEEYLKSK
jgi:hypothetical protein